MRLIIVQVLIYYEVRSIGVIPIPMQDIITDVSNKCYLLGFCVRLVPRELRQTSKGFYGAGCPHPVVECFMQKIQKLQAHYGCDANLGLKMSVSIEMLIVELGVSTQPFQESFNKYKDWVTWSWMVSVWEKCDMFKVVIDINDNFLKMPRRQVDYAAVCTGRLQQGRLAQTE